MSDDAKFIGGCRFTTETVHVGSPLTPLPTFRVYERVGVTGYQFTRGSLGEVNPQSLSPVLTREGLRAGMELVFPNGSGYWTAVVDPDLKTATGPTVIVSLEFDPSHSEAGFPAEWVGSCFFTRAALARVELCS